MIRTRDVDTVVQLISHFLRIVLETQGIIVYGYYNEKDRVMLVPWGFCCGVGQQILYDTVNFSAS